MSKKNEASAKITEMALAQEKIISELPTSAGRSVPDAVLGAAVLCSTMFSHTMATLMEVMIDLFAGEDSE